jgi:hypothetical protein
VLHFARVARIIAQVVVNPCPTKHLANSESSVVMSSVVMSSVDMSSIVMSSVVMSSIVMSSVVMSSVDMSSVDMSSVDMSVVAEHFALVRVCRRVAIWCMWTSLQT